MSVPPVQATPGGLPISKPDAKLFPPGGLPPQPQKNPEKTAIKSMQAFSASDFSKALNKTNPPYSISLFEQPAQQMAAGTSKNYTIAFACIPLIFLEVMAKQALESSLFPKETKVIVNANLCSWKIENDSVVRSDLGLFKIFENAGKEIKEKIISEKEAFSASTGTFLLFKSSNLPLQPSLLTGEGTTIISYFQDSISGTHKLLGNIEGLEWRYENAQLFQKDQLNFAVKELCLQGLIVEFQKPCLKFESHEKAKKIGCFHSMSVRIPKAKKDSFKNKIGSLFKKEFKLTVSKALDQISNELAFIAKQNPLVSRYAYDVRVLNEKHQQELLLQLKALGYDVSLDERPFFSQPFYQNANSKYETSVTQYIYIDLPDSAFLSSEETKSETKE